MNKMNKDLIRPLTKEDRGMVDKYIRASQYFQSSGKRISRRQWTGRHGRKRRTVPNVGRAEKREVPGVAGGKAKCHHPFAEPFIRNSMVLLPWDSTLAR